MKSLVSIIIPAYNVENYIEACIESAVNQSYSNIEIIVVNDGSTDGTLKKVELLKYKYNNIVLISQENSGLSIARNNALKIAKGEYIYFLDGDDIIDSNLVKYCYEAAEEENLDVIFFNGDIFYSNSKLSDDCEFNYNKSNKMESETISGKEYLVNAIKNDVYSSSVCLQFYRKEFLNKNSIKFKDGIIHEDELFSILILINAKKVKYINKILFHRRIRDNSIMTKKKTIKNALGYLTIATELSNIIKNIECESEIRNILIDKIEEFYYGAQYNSYVARYNGESKINFNDFNRLLKYDLEHNKLMRNKKIILRSKFPSIAYRGYVFKAILKKSIGR